VCFARDGVSWNVTSAATVRPQHAAEIDTPSGLKTGYCAPPMSEVSRSTDKEQWSVIPLVQRPDGIQSEKNHNATCPNDSIRLRAPVERAPHAEKIAVKQVAKPCINNQLVQTGEGFILGCGVHGRDAFSIRTIIITYPPHSNILS
jgi:hypothetical protein